MMENHLYNLMKQLVQENKSLWRIKKHYMEDAEGCEECQSFWKKLEEDKDAHVKELEEMIKKHM